MRFRVVIEEDEDGWLVAYCPSLPGCVSQGKTHEEVMENIHDAISGWLSALEDTNIPLSGDEILVDVSVS
jgi:predicted RNase H-like HicB family nuclease